jgi:uncharacterized protein
MGAPKEVPMHRTALTCLLLAAAVLPARAAAQEPPHPSPNPVPSLTVQGTGEVRADPDEAIVRLGVVTQAPTARAAQERVNQVAGAVLAALRGLGIEAVDIQTSELNLNPIYAPVRPEAPAQDQQRISGYQAGNVVSVRLAKLDLVGRAIDAGLAAGANQVEGVSFGLKDDAAAQARALEAAVHEARGKAQAIAAALGVRLGEVLEAAEGGASVVTPQPFPRIAAMAERSSSTPVSPGQLTVSASVTLRYRIAP